MIQPNTLCIPEITIADLTAMYLGPAAVGHEILDPYTGKDKNRKDKDWPDDAPTKTGTGDVPPGGDNPSKGGGRDDRQSREKGI